MHNPGYLLDLSWQAPSANIIVFMERDTKVRLEGWPVMKEDLLL